MNGVATPLVEWAAVERPSPGKPRGPVYQNTVRTTPRGVLVALVEAVGGSEDAPARAATALAVVERSVFAPLPVIVHECHRELMGTAGVTVSLALFDARRPALWWLGVGHLPGYVMASRRGSSYRTLPLHAGVIGQQLPVISATSAPLESRDTLIVVSDGVHWDPGRAPGRMDAPTVVAQHLVDEYGSPGEAAIALAVRYVGLAAAVHVR
jgi:hypothetical protein